MEYVTNCHWCHVTKGHCTGPLTQQGLLVANNPLDLLCIYFLKVDPSKGSRENPLVMTDDFTKFSHSFISMGFQPTFTVIRAKVLKTTSSSISTPCIKSSSAMTTPYNLHVSSICKKINHPLLDLIKTLPKEKKANWPLHIPSFMFTYNAMPHSITGYQSYEFMFGCKAYAACDAWLGLASYNDKASTGKCAGLNEQYELLMSVNR